MVCFILSRTPSTQQALHRLSSESHPIPVILTWQKRNSRTAASLAAFHSPAVWSSSKNLSPFHWILLFHTGGSRLTKETGVILLLSCLCTGNVFSLLMARNYSFQAIFQASKDLVSLSIFASTRINYRLSRASKHSMDLEPRPWLF